MLVPCNIHVIIPAKATLLNKGAKHGIQFEHADIDDQHLHT